MQQQWMCSQWMCSHNCSHWMCPQNHSWCILKTAHSLCILTTAHSLCILTTAHSLCILTTINRRRISTTIYKRHVLSTVYRRWVLHNRYVILYCIVCIFLMLMKLYISLRHRCTHISYFLLLIFISLWHTYFFQIIYVGEFMFVVVNSACYWMSAIFVFIRNRYSYWVNIRSGGCGYCFVDQRYILQSWWCFGKYLINEFLFLLMFKYIAKAVQVMAGILDMMLQGYRRSTSFEHL